MTWVLLALHNRPKQKQPLEVLPELHACIIIRIFRAICGSRGPWLKRAMIFHLSSVVYYSTLTILETYCESVRWQLFLFFSFRAFVPLRVTNSVNFFFRRASSPVPRSDKVRYNIRNRHRSSSPRLRFGQRLFHLRETLGFLFLSGPM
jgi:hypothetical protein